MTESKIKIKNNETDNNEIKKAEFKIETIEAFAEELKDYHCSKGAVQFPNKNPLPAELIENMVRFRVAEQMAKAKPKRTKRMQEMKKKEK